MDSSGEIVDVWDRTQLMAKAKAEANGNAAVNLSPRKSRKKELDKLMQWGQPGYLTAEEADVYVSVRNIRIFQSLAFNESLKVVSLSLSIITFR